MCDARLRHFLPKEGAGICDRITAVNTNTQPRISQPVMVSFKIKTPLSTAKTDSKLMIRDAAVVSKCF